MQLSANAITVIVMLTLVLSYGIGTFADILNLKHLKKEIPEEFKDHYDQKKYLKSQQYLKTNTGFGLITSAFDLVVLIGFWFAGGFNLVDTMARSMNYGPIITGLIFIAILMGLKQVLSLPFNLYATFVIEEKFGFNKTTPATFFIDLIKGLFLAVLFGGMILSAIFWFLEKTGSIAWLLCWGASTVFLFIVQYIVPTFIMPLFNKFTPLEDGPLKAKILEYASSIDFPLTNIFVMDGSKRSTKANAFFTGFGKNKRIVLFDTLINEQTIDELVSVLAHEMGHYKKNHIIKRMILAVLQMGFIFYLLSLCISLDGLFEAFFVDEPSVWTGVVFFGLLYAPVDLFLSVFMQMSSRKDEYEADRFAALTLGTATPLIAALKKLSSNNLSNLLPHPLYVFLNYSHPPVMNRISSLKNMS